MTNLQNKVLPLVAVILLCLGACSKSGDVTSELDNPNKDADKQVSEQVPARSIRAWSELSFSSQTASVHVLELDSLLNETGREFNMEKEIWLVSLFHKKFLTKFGKMENLIYLQQIQNCHIPGNYLS